MTNERIELGRLLREYGIYDTDLVQDILAVVGGGKTVEQLDTATFGVILPPTPDCAVCGDQTTGYKPVETEDELLRFGDMKESLVTAECVLGHTETYKWSTRWVWNWTESCGLSRNCKNRRVDGEKYCLSCILRFAAVGNNISEHYEMESLKNLIDEGGLDGINKTEQAQERIGILNHIYFESRDEMKVGLSIQFNWAYIHIYGRDLSDAKTGKFAQLRDWIVELFGKKDTLVRYEVAFKRMTIGVRLYEVGTL